MGKITHLQKILVLMVVVLLLTIKHDHWWSNIFVVTYMYYFAFATNLFVKIYNNENAATRLFFGMNEMPLIVAGIMIVGVILFMRRLYPDVDFKGAYLNALIGGITTTLARYKRSKFVKRDL